jgi:hypothetical protein
VTVPDLLPLGWWCLVAGVALAIAAAFLHVTEVRAVNTTPAPDPALWLPCHTTTCAHLTTPHQPTPHGPVCRTCGNTNGGHQ